MSAQDNTYAIVRLNNNHPCFVGPFNANKDAQEWLDGHQFTETAIASYDTVIPPHKDPKSRMFQKYKI